MADLLGRAEAADKADLPEVVLPKRWVVERTFAWLGRCRRLAKDGEATIASSEAWLRLASIRRMTRAVARTGKIRQMKYESVYYSTTGETTNLF